MNILCTRSVSAAGDTMRQEQHRHSTVRRSRHRTTHFQRWIMLFRALGLAHWWA